MSKAEQVPKERDNLMMGVTGERGELYPEDSTWEKRGRDSEHLQVESECSLTLRKVTCTALLYSRIPVYFQH